MLLPEAIVTLRALAQAAEDVGEKSTAALLSSTAREVETAAPGKAAIVAAGFADMLSACAERTAARADMFSRAAEALQSTAKGGA